MNLKAKKNIPYYSVFYQYDQEILKLRQIVLLNYKRQYKIAMLIETASHEVQRKVYAYNSI